MRRISTSLLAVLALTLTMAVPASAAPFFFGEDLDFAFIDAGVGGLNPPLGTFTDLNVSVLAGDEEIEESDAVGNIQGVMLQGEFIDVLDQSITFSIFGGGNVVSPGYRDPGLNNLARYELTDIFDPGDNLAITNVTLGATTNVLAPTVVFNFTANTITLSLVGLGILETIPNLGQLTLNVEISPLAPPPIPEPGTLALLGSGIAGAWIRRRRSSRSSAGVS